MEQSRRWYDKDPALFKAMGVLQGTDNKFQAQIALNLIRIIIEHNIESNAFRSVEDLLLAVNEGCCDKGNERWYDLDNTIRTAVQMLENCPADMQSKIAKDIGALLSDKLIHTYEADFQEEEYNY